MLAELRCTQLASAPELEDLRSDIDGYFHCHDVEDKLRRAQLLDAVLTILSQPSMSTRLLNLLCLKVSREIAFLWQQNPPQLITCLHELRLGSHARQRTFD